MVERGDVSGAELHAAYAAAIAERDGELHAYLRTAEANGRDGVPIAFKDLVCTRGIETTAGSRILAGYIPPYDATVATRCYEAGLPLLGKTNMDEFAMGSSTENSAYGPTRNPWDPGARAGRLVGRLDRRGRGRAGALGARLGHGRLDQAAGGALRRRRPAAHLRDGVALRHRRVRVEPRPGRADHEDGARLRAALPDDRRARPVRHDHGRSARAGRAPGGRRPEGAARRRAASSSTRPKASSRASPRAVRAAIELARAARRRGGRLRAAALGRVRAALLLPDRPVGGLDEPGALRRRPLRAARRRRGRARDVRAHARRRLRRRAEAADHARHVRACRPATTTRSTARRRRCGR